jgi:hypothetical protein
MSPRPVVTSQSGQMCAAHPSNPSHAKSLTLVSRIAAIAACCQSPVSSSMLLHTPEPSCPQRQCRQGPSAQPNARHGLGLATTAFQNVPCRHPAYAQRACRYPSSESIQSVTLTRPLTLFPSHPHAVTPTSNLLHLPSPPSLVRHDGRLCVSPLPTGFVRCHRSIGGFSHPVAQGSQCFFSSLHLLRPNKIYLP